MQFINFTGDFAILKRKGFILDMSKDPFQEGTVSKAIGKGYSIIIRKNREIRMFMSNLIFPGVEMLEPILTKMEIPYEIIGEKKEKKEED